jgi:putative ABC transport system substrate-binding protein
MRRRQFVTILGGTAAAWLRPASAQAEDDAGDGFSQQQIAQRGGDRGRRVSPGPGRNRLFERQNLVIEYRWAEGRFDLLPALAADLVGRKVDVIVATGGAPS